MLAIVVERLGGHEVLSPAERPDPIPGPGQVRVRNRAIGINFIEIYQRRGLYPMTTPYTPGAEGMGVVDAIGEGVTLVQPGDRVGYVNGLGSYADATLVPAERTIPVPRGVDDDAAGAVLLQGMTAQYLSNATYPIQPGDPVVVHAAAGGVGALLVQLAKKRGGTVIATVGSDAKAEIAKAAGADRVINYVDDDFQLETKRFTNDAGAACVYDSVGKDTFEKSLHSLRPRGYCVLYGASSGPVPPFDPQRLNALGSLFVTRPTLVHYTITRDELLERANALFGLMERGELDVRIGHRYPLREAGQAHNDLENRRTTGKLLLIPEGA